MRKAIILLPLLLLGMLANAQRVVDNKGTQRLADTTNDAWINDNANTMIKLGTLSDGITARAVGTEFVVKDNGRLGIGIENPAWLLDVQGANAIGQFKRFSAAAGNTSPGFLFTRARGTFAAQADILAGDYLGKVQFRGHLGNSDVDFATFGYIANTATAEDGRFGFFSGSGGGGGGGEEFMSINTKTGRVGIGVSNPSYKLQVTGQAHADSTISAPNYTATVQTTATGSSYTWNMDLGANAAWTLAAGANTLTISNAKAGMFGLIRVTNNGTSSITLPAGSKVINGGAGVVPLTQTASAVDILTFYYDGTNYWWTYGNNYN